MTRTDLASPREPRDAGQGGREILQDGRSSPLLTAFQYGFAPALLSLVVGTHAVFAARVEHLNYILSIVLWATLFTLERFVPYRRDWLLTKREAGVDAFYYVGNGIGWIVPIVLLYSVPLSRLSDAFRAHVGLPKLAVASGPVAGLFWVLVIMLTSSFIDYWVHRWMHWSKIGWRLHGVHHHASTLSFMKNWRNHPLELFPILLGNAILVGLLGADPLTADTATLFRITLSSITHANLPLRSGIWGYVITTTEQHRMHHARDFAASNTNFGCHVILWDRLFGTYSEPTPVADVGNGTGRELTLREQLQFPFLPWRRLTTL